MAATRRTAALALLAVLTAAGAAKAAYAGFDENVAAGGADPALLSLPAAESTMFRDAPQLMSWPCLDAPGCDAGRPAQAASAPRTQAAPAQAALIPLPAALALLGLGMSAMGVMMHRSRPQG